MPELPQKLDHTFTALIGVNVKDEIWPCVEVPGSAELFETRRSVRVDATVDGVAVRDVGLLVTGRGGHTALPQRDSAKTPRWKGNRRRGGRLPPTPPPLRYPPDLYVNPDRTLGL